MVKQFRCNVMRLVGVPEAMGGVLEFDLLNKNVDQADVYGAKFALLRRKLVETLGTDTVDLILERGVREVSQVYPGFTLVAEDDGNLRLGWVRDELAEHSEDHSRNAYSALYAAMLVILARILGREIAVRLASAVDAERVLQGSPLAP